MIEFLQQTSYYVSQQQCYVDQIQHGSNLLYQCYLSEKMIYNKI